ncbi:uncharacterized protein LOC144354682 [Saccoglossus kowalevskii]
MIRHAVVLIIVVGCVFCSSLSDDRTNVDLPEYSTGYLLVLVLHLFHDNIIMIRHAVVLIIVVGCVFCSSLSDDRTNVDLPELQVGIGNASRERREVAVLATECYSLDDGSDYRGKVSVTKTGRTCQKWTHQTPHEHPKTPDNYPNTGLGSHNYCRNPTHRPYGAWCFTTDPNKRSEYCDIGTKQNKCHHTTVAPEVTSSKSGVPFTRWGHSSCPDHTTLVYSGIMGGKHPNKKGSGTNYLCLPNEPKEIDGSVISGPQFDRGDIYNTQYYTTDGPFARQRYHDLPCAVCWDPDHSSTILYPARDDCPSDWRNEYSGYLMTARDNQYATEFVCVDRAGEILVGTASEAFGALLSWVEPVCNTAEGLPCGPYVNGHELSCAVCAK